MQVDNKKSIWIWPCCNFTEMGAMPTIERAYQRQFCPRCLHSLLGWYKCGLTKTSPDIAIQKYKAIMGSK
jgi:hypothetical protein